MLSVLTALVCEDYTLAWVRCFVCLAPMQPLSRRGAESLFCRVSCPVLTSLVSDVVFSCLFCLSPWSSRFILRHPFRGSTWCSWRIPFESPPTAGEISWGGRTDQRPWHLHTATCFSFVSRRCLLSEPTHLDGFEPGQGFAAWGGRVVPSRVIRRPSVPDGTALPGSKARAQLASLFGWHQQLSIRPAAGKTNTLATFIHLWHLASWLWLWMKRGGSVNRRWFRRRAMRNG